MTLNDFDKYFRSFLKIEDYMSDVSRNGIQIQNSAPDSKEIKKIAFAVDACEETVLKAAEENADILFVHHGLFWGGCEPIVNHIYKRISPFIKNDIALYACHIPLDANNPYGNNYGLAARLNLEDLEPFGEWRGMKIGVKGKLKEPMTLGEIAKKVLNDNEKPLRVLSFGKEKINTIGIISGGGGDDVYQAIEEGLDAYITGEYEHSLYHYTKECNMNVIVAGHYQTETVGINLVKQKIEKELNIPCVFIDVPTGM